MANVEIYTKSYCPYCKAAKELLKRKNITFAEYDVEHDDTRREEMLSRSNGRTTVPEIFISGKHIGGFDDMSALDQTGELDKMLAG